MFVRRVVRSAVRTSLAVTGTTLVLAGVMMLGCAGLAGCVRTVYLMPEIPTSEELSDCETTILIPLNMDEAEVFELLEQVEEFALSQTALLMTCRDKVRALNALIEEHNEKAAYERAPWYRRIV